MKKHLSAILSFAVALSANAQSEVTQNDSITTTQEQVSADSLHQLVNTLQEERLQKEKEEKLRRQWSRPKYFNLFYGKQDLDMKGQTPVRFDSDIHAGLGIGKTFYLHKKPILGLIKFGLDWTYFQVDYTKYSFDDVYTDFGIGPDGTWGEQEITETYNMHKVELGMQFGPSITVRPVGSLKVNAYFRYAPSASIFCLEEEFSASYGSYFVSGAALSYKVISLGVEARWGHAKFDDFTYVTPETPEYDPNAEESELPQCKFKSSGVRVYLSFRF